MSCTLKEIIFLWTYSWGKIIYPYYLQLHDDITLSNISIHTSFLILVIYNSFYMIESTLIILTYCIPSWYHDSNNEIPSKVEFSVRRLLLPRDDPSSEYSNRGSWLSSSCKLFLLMMCDALYTRWLSSTHKYYLCFQWGYQELLYFNDDIHRILLQLNFKSLMMISCDPTSIICTYNSIS